VGNTATPTSGTVGAEAMWDLKRLADPPPVHPADGFAEEGVEALFFDGLPYRGRPTHVFAWLGMPTRDAQRQCSTLDGDRTERPERRASSVQRRGVPGVVLIHGGGGTAFARWVRRWNERGYAAIAIDTCGCVPRGTYGNWERHALGGPAGWGSFGQIDEPREDQWTYHAVADVLLAHSLLRSRRGADAARIGVTGISWGGYLTSIVAGVDRRFRFAVPVYGCGFTNENGFAGSVTGLGPERAERWMRWWDPSVYLPHARMPMLWVNGSNDFAYTLPAFQKSYRLPRGPRSLCIRLRMKHGQQEGEAVREIPVFADAFTNGGAPLPAITGQRREGDRVTVRFRGARPIVKAELNVTRDSGRWQDRRWEALPAHVEPSGNMTATLPAGVTAYYLNLLDDGDCLVSTEHVEQRPETAHG
jgi:dienelactone hydrolase